MLLYSSLFSDSWSQPIIDELGALHNCSSKNVSFEVFSSLGYLSAFKASRAHPKSPYLADDEIVRAPERICSNYELRF